MKAIYTFLFCFCRLHSFSQHAQTPMPDGKPNRTIQVSMDISKTALDRSPIIPVQTLSTACLSRPDKVLPIIQIAFPVNGILDLLCQTAGVYQVRRGDALRVFGCRPEGVLYVVDGVQIARR